MFTSIQGGMNSHNMQNLSSTPLSFSFLLLFCLFLNGNLFFIEYTPEAKWAELYVVYHLQVKSRGHVGRGDGMSSYVLTMVMALF